MPQPSSAALRRPGVARKPKISATREPTAPNPTDIFNTMGATTTATKRGTATDGAQKRKRRRRNARTDVSSSSESSSSDDSDSESEAEEVEVEMKVREERCTKWDGGING